MKENNVALSLGGNVGDVKSNMLNAMNELIKAGFKEASISSFYLTEPVDCAPGTPDFINAALTGTWSRTSSELHKLCIQLEKNAGRQKTQRPNASRPLDIDIILFGEDIIKTPELTIPHPRAADRPFVLIPLAETVPGWKFPDTGQSVYETLGKLSGNKKNLRRLQS